jgi:transposase
MATIPREVLEKACDDEKDADTRLRMLLVLKVKYDGIGQNQAARELHCLSSWASKWIRRFETQGIEGLETRERSGRPPKVKHNTIVRIKRKVVRSECGWSAREVRELIRKDADVTYTERHVYRLLHRWGVRTIVPDKRLLHKASLEDRLAFKKERRGSSGTSQMGSQLFPKTSQSLSRT